MTEDTPILSPALSEVQFVAERAVELLAAEAETQRLARMLMKESTDAHGIKSFEVLPLLQSKEYIAACERRAALSAEWADNSLQRIAEYVPHLLAEVARLTAEREALRAEIADMVKENHAICDMATAAKAEGRAEVYAQIRQLPSPWDWSVKMDGRLDVQAFWQDCDGRGTTVDAHWRYSCQWCDAVVRIDTPYDAPRPVPAHPANDCPWSAAHATPQEEGQSHA
jgi:hypothetical protein